MLVQHKEITDKIIKAFYTVYNNLGYGFLEKVYENAMSIEIANMDLSVRQQHPINVWYDGDLIGEYYADLLVEDCVIVELKSASEFNPVHKLQLRNYLKATNIEVGLLMNFGSKPKFERQYFNIS